jgi:anti-sigma B factor antagonist
MPDHQPIAVPPFEVRFDEDGDAVTLSFRGELDLANSAATEEGLERALKNGAARVVVDLTELTFIDSTGIALFVQAKREDGDDRLLFRPSNSTAVRRVLAVTGVDEWLGLLDGKADGDGPT